MSRADFERVLADIRESYLAKEAARALGARGLYPALAPYRSIEDYEAITTTKTQWRVIDALARAYRQDPTPLRDGVFALLVLVMRWMLLRLSTWAEPGVLLGGLLNAIQRGWKTPHYGALHAASREYQTTKKFKAEIPTEDIHRFELSGEMPDIIRLVRLNRVVATHFHPRQQAVACLLAQDYTTLEISDELLHHYNKSPSAQERKREHHRTLQNVARLRARLRTLVCEGVL